MKPLIWKGSSLEDLRAFSEEVRQVMGYALFLAQTGGKHPDAKPLKGFGRAGVLEAIDDYAGDTYRVNGRDDSKVAESSGNVFADLGVGDPDEALVKAELARAIAALVNARRLTQTQAAELLSIDQPKVSALMRGRLSGFSIDRLLRFLLALDRDVEIVVRPKKESRPRVNVVGGA